jgi:ribonuclease HI
MPEYPVDLLPAAPKKMVYFMEVYVDGGCRGNGRPGSIGAAAAVFKNRRGRHKTWIRCLPRYPPATNQRAEITAIIIALEQILEKYDELYFHPRLKVKLYSDSRYAIGCMTEWIYNWTQNGWKNAAGYRVANRDLIEEASYLHDIVTGLGDIEYIWIPRSENWEADEACNEAMDNTY